MTMSASRIEKSPNIKVQITYGPVTASVDEDHRHLRGFHDQLGRLLDAAEEEAEAERAAQSSDAT